MPLIGGFRRQVEDLRDLKFHELELKRALVDAPTVILPERTPISDQLQLSSCVANATCDALEQVLEGPVVQLSRLFVYWNARRRRGDECNDAGTFVRDAFWTLGKLGVPKEDYWPYDPPEVNVRPTLKAYEQAYEHKVGGYYAIQGTGATRLAQMERAIRSGLPVVFGTDVGDEFENYDGKSVLEFPAVPKGGHAMVVTGFLAGKKGNKTWRVRNSWGKSFGDQGYCLMSSDYMTNAATSDLWVPVPIEYR